MDQRTKEVIHDALSKEHACFVLITCDPPTDEGNMNVQLSYEGDVTLASYMLQGAQDILDDVLESGPDEDHTAPLRLIE